MFCWALEPVRRPQGVGSREPSSGGPRGRHNRQGGGGAPRPPPLGYVLDLGLSYFWLFPGLKKLLRGQRFRDDEDLKTVLMLWLEGVEQEFFSTGIRVFQGRWALAKARKGSYVED